MKIGVRVLAELVCRAGDIHTRFDERTAAEEGIATQRRIQGTRGDAYEREVSVSFRWQSGRSEPIEISGRIDGIDRSGSRPVIEEFKTSREPAERLFAHAGPLHLAQARLYAALQARNQPEHLHWGLRIVYCHPDTDSIRTFEEFVTADSLESYLDSVCRRFALALARLRLHRRRRDRALRRLEFPYSELHPVQRQLARAVYRTARDGSSLLAEAPTGSGKTLGTLFPALRAVGDGHADRIVFLTARGTGQMTAGAAAAQLTAPAVPLRWITVTARQRICFQPEPRCDPAYCEFARGYYDRLPGALHDVLECRPIDRDAIEAAARKHGICPFELSLDAAVWSDVVSCDYNYVFDPVVRLQRLRGVTADRALLLVDEAHQLTDRVREALSVDLDRGLVATALSAAPDAATARALRGLDRRLTTLRRVHVATSDRARAFEVQVPSVDGVVRSIDAVLDVLDSAASRGGDMPDERSASVMNELTFTLSRFKRALGWFDPTRFAFILRGGRSELVLSLRCLDSGAHIAQVLNEFPAHVRFSGSLTPMSLFARLHGITSTPSLRLPSPFPVEHLAVMVVRDVSARFRDRERSLDRLVSVLETLVRARRGNYLVAAPSFTYLRTVADRFARSNPDIELIVQSADMPAESRAAFLRRFEVPDRPTVGFIVLGGIFAESVDLPGDRLIGMAIIGVGLAPPSLERDLQSSCLGDVGELAAYRYPAVAKVVQAAGRLIRGPTDRGVLCLIDDRYLREEYRLLLPSHWRALPVRSSGLATALDTFWNTG